MYRVSDGAQIYEYIDENNLSDNVVIAKIKSSLQARADLKQQALDIQTEIEENTNG